MVKKIKVPVYNKPKGIVKSTEPMIIQEQIDSLQRQIRSLIAQKKALQRQLKKQGMKKIPSTYREKTIILYVLELENNCWYVGQTRNLEKRYKHHEKGKGAIWTKANKPIDVHFSKDTGLTSDSEVAFLEDELTLEYARKYGIEKVRGGGYCQSKPRWPRDVLEPDLSWANS